MPSFISQDDSLESSAQKQVQFGRDPSACSSDQSFNIYIEGADRRDSETSQNINERLRHHASVAAKNIDDFGVLQAQIYTSLLLQTLEELVVIRNMNRMSRADVNLVYTTLKDKYENSQHELDAIVNNCEEYFVYKKFRNDLSWLEAILQKTMWDVRKTYYFGELLKILKNELLAKEEVQTIITGKAFNRREIGKLKYYMEVERREMTAAIQKLTHRLGNFKDLLNDNIAESTVKLNYVKTWEKSRYEQNQEHLKIKELGYSNKTSFMNHNIEKENVVHDEMSMYIEESLQDYQNDIEKWMDKYDFDLEEKENQVHSLKINKEKQKEEYTQLLEEYETRQQKMEDYKAHKRELEKEARELARQTKAVTKIQAWWRGVMFRKGLGPYRKRKKGKGRKKTGKKK